MTEMMASARVKFKSVAAARTYGTMAPVSPGLTLLPFDQEKAAANAAGTFVLLLDGVNLFISQMMAFFFGHFFG